MISKRVRNESQDNFGVLANYIAAEHETDKLDAFWMVNCKAGDQLDDLDLAIIEIENTQAENYRAKGSKTYHLIISLQSGESLPEDDLKDIVARFTDCLGFKEHQHVVAAHSNTENYHIHVAYNMINPDTHTIHHPPWDYYARDAVCRGIERDYDLKIDNGHDKWIKWRDDPDYVEQHVRTPSKARDMEAHSHLQSFTTHVREQRDDIQSRIDKAKNWQELHESLAEIDLELKARGNGLVFSNGAYDDGCSARLYHTKASNIDRTISKAKLEKKLGAYVASPKAKPEPPTLAAVIKQHRDTLMAEVDQAQHWQDVHEIFDRYGLEIKKRGNGLAVYYYNDTSLATPSAVTASQIYRGLSKKHLEQRLGSFVRPESVLDQLTQAPEMLGSVVQSCENWQDVHQTLQSFQVTLKHRGQGYIKANYDQRDILLDLGARWDKNVKRWYIPEGIPSKEFADFSMGYILSDGKYNVMSDTLPGLDRTALENKFGAYASINPPKPKPEKATYKPKPLQPLKSKQSRLLWNRYLKNKKNSPALTWKEFLLVMAGTDPMAVALLNAGRKLMGTLDEMFQPVPKRPTTKPYDPLANEKYEPLYIRVPFKDQFEAKKLGAKWDPNKQSWFIPHDKRSFKARQAFSQWPLDLPKKTGTISRQKAQAIGMTEDRAMER